MLKRSELNSRSQSSAADRKTRAKKNRLRSRLQSRRLQMEGLEARQLLAAEVVDIPVVDPALFAAQAPRNIGDVPAFDVSEGEAANETGVNDTFLTATFLPLGTGPGQQDTIDITGAMPVTTDPIRGNTVTDVDTFAFDLRAGDILDVSVLGAAGNLTVSYGDGSFWFGSDSQQNVVLPSNSPLTSTGNANASQVIPEDGRYYLTLAPSSTQATYTAGLRVYRPVAESLPVGAQQYLYLDLDGGFYPTSLFPGALPQGIVRVTGLPNSLPALGIQADDDQALDDLITQLVEEVERNYATVTVDGGNGNYNESGVAGEYGITVLNSRDHADPGFDNPLVTRIIVATQVETGFGTGLLGIAQSVDIGNFDMGENALVLVDDVLAAATAFPIAPTSSQLDAVARRMATTISHEAAHTFGLRHTNGDNFVGNIIDEGPGINTNFFRLGVGPDGIFGTVDDTEIGFPTDQFSLNEGLFGFSRTAESLAWGLAT
ncbi:MAG: PPC domain-containing protein, partial [Planctomycetota bacterium]